MFDILLLSVSVYFLYSILDSRVNHIIAFAVCVFFILFIGWVNGAYYYRGDPNPSIAKNEEIMEVLYSTSTEKGVVVLVKDVKGIKLYNVNKVPPTHFVIVNGQYVQVSTGTAVTK